MVQEKNKKMSLELLDTEEPQEDTTNYDMKVGLTFQEAQMCLLPHADEFLFYLSYCMCMCVCVCVSMCTEMAELRPEVQLSR